MRPVSTYLKERMSDPIRAERIEAKRQEIRTELRNYWTHYCGAEGGIIGTETGQPCNWCDVKEPEKEEFK